MPRIPEEVIGEVRDRTDIVAVVGERVQLRKAGGSFKGLCPFHQEKSPSFHVSPDKRFFHCFGCQKSGDVFTFLMEVDGKSFVEAARELAGRAGVTIPEEAETPEERTRRDERARLLELNALAATWFRETLLGPAGEKARAYLAQRGIGDAVAETFRLGMAPDAWDGLTRMLTDRGAPGGGSLGSAGRGAEGPRLEKAAVLGLVAARTRGPGFYDRFRNRVMCPVILPAGEVVAFSGRDLGGGTAGGGGDTNDVPKYINSTGSPVYTKGHVLFGLHAARPAFRKKGRAILVEGNFDVIALHQAGFDETIAPLGTALTDRQVESLRLLVPRVVLCLDGDAAGRKAAKHDLVPLIAAGVDVRVVALPDGEDPDSMVRKLGPEGFEELVTNARPGAKYFLDEVWGKSDKSTASRTDAVRECVPLLSRIDDETRRDILLGELAQGLGIEPGIVRREVLRARSAPAAWANAHQGRNSNSFQAPAASAPRPAASAQVVLPPARELELLALLADHPGLLKEAETLGVGSFLTDTRVRDMYSASQAGRTLHESIPPELSNVVAKKVLTGAFKDVLDPTRTLREIASVLQADQVQVAMRELKREQDEAIARGDAEAARGFAMKLNETRQRADALRRRPEERTR